MLFLNYYLFSLVDTSDSILVLTRVSFFFFFLLISFGLNSKFQEIIVNIFKNLSIKLYKVIIEFKPVIKHIGQPNNAGKSSFNYFQAIAFDRAEFQVILKSPDLKALKINIKDIISEPRRLGNNILASFIYKREWYIIILIMYFLRSILGYVYFKLTELYDPKEPYLLFVYLILIFEALRTCLNLFFKMLYFLQITLANIQTINSNEEVNLTSQPTNIPHDTLAQKVHVASDVWAIAENARIDAYTPTSFHGFLYYIFWGPIIKGIKPVHKANAAHLLHQGITKSSISVVKIKWTQNKSEILLISTIFVLTLIFGIDSLDIFQTSFNEIFLNWQNLTFTHLVIRTITVLFFHFKLEFNPFFWILTLIKFSIKEANKYYGVISNKSTRKRASE